MISDFLSSWDLFHNAYLAGWMIGLMLSLVGVVVVARDQIFIGASVSQASTLGVATGMWFGHFVVGDSHPWFQSDTFLSLMAVAFAVGAALLTARGGGLGRESYESITGWVFLLSSSGAILIISKSPHGLEEIHRVISSSIIGASAADVWLFLSLSIVSIAVLLANRQKLILFAMDPAMAAAVGVRTGFWSLLISGWLGFVIALSIRTAGALFAFGFLVLPALFAKNVCREVRPMFWVSPIVGILAGISGFVIANYHEYDYPPAQMAVALLCMALAGAWIYRALSARFRKH